MHTHAHIGHEPNIPGVTEDTLLRPLGVLLILFGAEFGIYAGMAVEAGNFAVPRIAGGLIVAGLLLAAIGKRAEEV